MKLPIFPQDKLYHLGLGCAWVFIAFVAAMLQVSYGIGPAVASSPKSLMRYVPPCRASCSGHFRRSDKS